MNSKYKCHYDLIRDMSVDDLAAFLTSLIHERDMVMLEKLKAYGIEASMVELPFEVQCEIHKKSLLEPINIEESNQ